MYNILKCQCKLMFSKKNFWIGFFTVTCYALASYLVHVKGYYNKDLSQVSDRRELVCFWTFDSMLKYLDVLFPFLVVLPFSMSYFEDCDSKMLGFWLRRTGKKKYYTAKAIVSFMGSFLMIAIPFLANLILVWITFPENGELNDGPLFSEIFYHNLNGLHELGQTYWYPLLYLLMFQPFLYNCLYILLISVLSGVLGVVAYSVSFFIKKYKLLLLLPIYLFFWVLSMLDTYTDGFTKELFDYVLRGNEFDSYLYFYCVLGILVIVSVVLIRRQIKKDVK